ncbi:Inner membrane protein YgaP [Symmachiella dynata]|uniref:rhodanese-like domain-containing protein n=1 Tax=Symmachiella dynata TaxID=2527995 RepID=UPI001187F839|nr:rhodanese-like domain-containing protein [Symmachiella dynata]QDT51595.1 Inner membrane protein YgaP [Symmachiella dynata]
MATLKTISVQELAEIGDQKKVELIDVRTPAEFRETHATIARNVPLDALNPEKLLADRNGSGDQPLYVICNSGNRSSKACEKLIHAGCENVVNVEGGTQAWEQANLPVVRGKKTVSLERQVRIAAGSLVLLGSVLALTVHPYFAGLAAFVGAGLVFAGVTDTCGMAMLLAKMPWNRVSGDDQQCRVA